MAQYKSYIVKYDPVSAKYVRLKKQGSSADLQCLVSFRPDDRDAPLRATDADTDAANSAILEAANILNTSIFKNCSAAKKQESSTDLPYVVITQRKENASNLYLENFEALNETVLLDLQTALTDYSLPIKFYELKPPIISVENNLLQISNYNLDDCILEGFVSGRQETWGDFHEYLDTLATPIIIPALKSVILNAANLQLTSPIIKMHSADLSFKATEEGNSYRWTPTIDVYHPQPPESDIISWINPDN